MSATSKPRSAQRLLVCAVVAVLVLTSAIPAAALLIQTRSVGSNTLTTTSVDPPTLDTASADTLLCTITLSWTAPATGVAPDGYEIYRSTTNGGPYGFVKEVGTVTTAADTGLSANTTYYYVLRSTHLSWQSGNSNQRSAKTSLLCA